MGLHIPVDNCDQPSRRLTGFAVRFSIVHTDGGLQKGYVCFPEEETHCKTETPTA
jgi:hypothetical protein